MINLTLDITIDMLLDGRLTLVYRNPNGQWDQKSCWAAPNLQSRWDSDFNRQYFPEAKTTVLHYELQLPKGCIVDVVKSTIELGYTGHRDSWVGPGRLFQYSLHKYIDQDVIEI